MRGQNLLKVIALSLFGLVWCAQVFSESVDWLYRVEVSVADQTVKSRQMAEKTALEELLIRISGLRDLPEHVAIDRALSRPGLYYNSFYYRDIKSSDGEEDFDRTVLNLEFDSGAVLQLLKAASLPIWPADRPRVLGWIVLESSGERQVVGSLDSTDFTRSLARKATERGLPLILPLMDLQDRMAVEPGVVIGRFERALWEASERYEAEIILVGKGQRLSDGNWVMDWELLLGQGGPIAFAKSEDLANLSLDKGTAFIENTSIQSVIAANGVDFVADQLAQRFSVLGDMENQFTLSVNGISNLESYSSLLNYLADLEVVDEIMVKKVNDRQVTIGLLTQADVAQLLHIFSQDNNLLVPKENVIEVSLEGILELIWQP